MNRVDKWTDIKTSVKRVLRSRQCVQNSQEDFRMKMEKLWNNQVVLKALSYIRWLDAGFSPSRPGFNPELLRSGIRGGRSGTATRSSTSSVLPNSIKNRDTAKGRA